MNPSPTTTKALKPLMRDGAVFESCTQPQHRRIVGVLKDTVFYSRGGQPYPLLQIRDHAPLDQRQRRGTESERI